MTLRTVALALLFTLPLPLHARPFSSRDEFAFANETVWSYDGKSTGNDDTAQGSPDDPTKEKYSRRCFVMVRAALQFHKFARFDPQGVEVNDAELERRIREVCDRDVWKAPLARDERIVFPGYADLRAFSKAKPELVKRNIGLGWPTYFRVGNFCIIFPPGKGSMTETNRRLEAALKDGEPRALWLVNFPSLSINHVVLAYAEAGSDAKTARYRVYDPNYAGWNFTLVFDKERGIFTYPKTFYFPGGDVHARMVYTGVFE
ncbi:MAG TPA: hypothetical protein VIM58_00495 [Candidatus Methylacidiphilales bacterium]